MNGGANLEDVRATDPVERLLEESWESRIRTAAPRELITETGAALLFLAVAVPMALPALTAGQVRVSVALLLVALYAIAARAIRFPFGTGYAVPSYMVLVPMLLLLPPRTVPLMAAAALVIGTIGRLAVRRAKAQSLLFSVADGWHTVGPALVLWLAGPEHGLGRASVYFAAFLAGGVVDLVTSTIREVVAFQVAPKLQVRIMGIVWLIDGCMASLGLLVAHAARHEPAQLLLLLPVMGLLMAIDRDRNARIEQAQHRLGVVARERTRLQAAVHRLGDAFAAKLDLGALSNVVLNGTIDALDADAGRLMLHAPTIEPIHVEVGAAELDEALVAAARDAEAHGEQFEHDDQEINVLAMPFTVSADAGGALAVARRGRPFRDDERALMRGLVERAQTAVDDILAHEALREQAVTDPLTRLGNRRKLAEQLADHLINASTTSPLVLMLFDLDGFKSYNDTFGHLAGDALLARIGNKLRAAVSPQGTAYRLGGDEFCVLLPAHPEALQETIAAAAAALEERGETFAITASCGTVLLPHEATTADYALQLADERMYAHKHGRPSGAREQAHDVLIHIMQAKQPGLPDHAGGVAEIAVSVGRRMGMNAEELDELGRAAALHDVGKVGIPDTILSKPGPLDEQEWSFVRQHSVLGERILSAAPALRPVATIVRATHERWDGNGYPDGLKGQEIPLAARIVAVCHAYEAITTDRCYRPAQPTAVAREELLREAGRQFDPAVVAEFLAELDRHGSRLAAADESARERRTAMASEVASHIHSLLAQQA